MDDRSPEEFLTDLQERADEMTRQSQQLQDQLGSLTETASDGGVSVTVGANGALQDLQIDQRAMQRGPSELRTIILRLAGEAQANVAGRAGGGTVHRCHRDGVPAHPTTGRTART